MENYSKGKNVEEPLERGKIPIPDLPSDFLWMQVRGCSKIRNLLTHALNEFPKVKCVVWTGVGPSLGKAITCAEIMKREVEGTLHQVTKICYRLVEEYWDPKIPELDQLVVYRKLPMIHILLSTQELNKDELGYQAPGQTFKIGPTNENGLRKSKQTPAKEFVAMGSKSKRKQKRFKQNNQKSNNNKDQS